MIKYYYIYLAVLYIFFENKVIFVLFLDPFFSFHSHFDDQPLPQPLLILADALMKAIFKNNDRVQQNINKTALLKFHYKRKH